MSAPPKYRIVRADQMGDGGEMPGWALSAFGAINQTLREVCNSLGKGLTRGDNMLAGSKAGLVYTTPASGANTTKVQCDMASPPKHFWVSRLERDDGTAISSAWSITWRNLAGTQVEVTFQGLTASTKYVFSCLYE